MLKRLLPVFGAQSFKNPLQGSSDRIDPCVSVSSELEAEHA